MSKASYKKKKKERKKGASCPVLAGPSMVLGPGFSPQRLSMGDSSQEG